MIRHYEHQENNLVIVFFKTDMTSSPAPYPSLSPEGRKGQILPPEGGCEAVSSSDVRRTEGGLLPNYFLNFHKYRTTFCQIIFAWILIFGSA